MSEQRDHETVRASRVELVDERGRVRLALGRLERHEGAEGDFGLSVLDATGATRVWLALEATGPALVFDLGGNIALHLGVDDPADPDEYAGAFVHLADGTGRPVLDVLTSVDGTLTVRTADER